MKPTSLFAVLVGSGIGVIAALLGREPPGEPPPLAPAAARPVEPAPASASASAGPENQAVTTPAGVAGEPLVGAEAPIASPGELEAAAVACEEKDAGACRRAAAAAELGQVAPKDPERAKKLRRIELTLLVRGCEKGGVAACLTLADRYLRGDGLERSERTATALIEHAKEICARRPEDACSGIPRN